MRRIDFSGTAAGLRVSRAILKLLCRSSGGTQRSSPNVTRVNSHRRSCPIAASREKTSWERRERKFLFELRGDPSAVKIRSRNVTARAFADNADDILLHART